MFDERQYDVIQENTGVGAYTAKVFLWMFIGLLVTAVASYGLAASGLGLLFYSNPIIAIASVIIEFALVFYIAGFQGRDMVRGSSGSTYIKDMSATRTKLAFIIYSIVNGVTLAGLLYMYAAAYGSMLIVKAFTTTALTFGAMALYGYTTKKDLTGIGRVLTMLLVGIIIATLVNVVFGLFGAFSSTLDLAISYVAVVVFAGLTAWDTQKIKAIYYQAQGNEALLDRLSISGALVLYLDFINLFLYILRIFARNRD